MRKERHLRAGFALLMLVFLISPVMGAGKVYYVDGNNPSGSDSNPGTRSQPWSTIQYASEIVQPGDTVYIRTGIYYEHIYIEHSGNASGFIVYAAYPGENPIIDGSGVDESQNGIVIDKSYIKLIGLKIRNWEENGIWMESASHIEIADCEIYDVAYGIGVADGTHDFMLNRVVMHDFDLYGFDASPSGGADCYNGAIVDCIAHTGRDPDQNVDGFALGHGSQHHIIFNRCKAYDVYDGFDVGENDGDSDIRIVLDRCKSYDCWNDGYKLTGGATLLNCIGYRNASSNAAVYWASNPGTARIRNCTFFDAETYNVWVESSQDSLHMYNCLLAGGDNIGLAFEQHSVANYRGDFNIFHNDNTSRGVAVAYEDEFSIGQIESGAWAAYSGEDSNSRVSWSDSSLFVNPSIYDLHLLNGSIAIDHGTSYGAPQHDYEGYPRPSGAGYDIGAYELQSSADPTLSDN